MHAIFSEIMSSAFLVIFVILFVVEMLLYRFMEYLRYPQNGFFAFPKLSRLIRKPSLLISESSIRTGVHSFLLAVLLRFLTDPDAHQLLLMKNFIPMILVILASVWITYCNDMVEVAGCDYKLAWLVYWLSLLVLFASTWTDHPFAAVATIIAALFLVLIVVLVYTFVFN